MSAATLERRNAAAAEGFRALRDARTALAQGRAKDVAKQLEAAERALREILRATDALETELAAAAYEAAGLLRPPEPHEERRRAAAAAAAEDMQAEPGGV